jgi:hypothetical protein
MSLGNVLRASPTFSSQFDPNGNRYRWGDYSAVALQYSNSNNAWIVNEWAETSSIWGSHITQIGFSPACP